VIQAIASSQSKNMVIVRGTTIHCGKYILSMHLRINKRYFLRAVTACLNGLQITNSKTQGPYRHSLLWGLFK